MPVVVPKVRSCSNKYQKLEMASELGRGWTSFEVMIRLARILLLRGERWLGQRMAYRPRPGDLSCPEPLSKCLTW